MKVLVIYKNGFGVVEIKDATSITLSNNTYTITASGNTQSFSADLYRVSIAW